jgi:hypothetical protein
MNVRDTGITKKLCKKIGLNWEEGKNRRLGRSTALAFQFLGQSLAHPGEEIHIFDHHKPQNHSSIKHVMNLIKVVCNKMELKGINFNLSNRSIIYLVKQLTK